MKQDGTSCNRKTKSVSTGLSGSRLIHTIEPLENVLLQFFRYTYPGIRYFKIQKFVIGIQRHTNPSIVIIIFDRIFDQISKSHTDLDFIQLCRNRTYAFKDQLNIPLIGDTIGDVQDLISMLHDYYHGSYKKVPAVVMLGTAVIVAYLVSPFDLIPDNVPLLGFIDDALIINLVIQLCIDKELDRYRAWRAGLETQEI